MAEGVLGAAASEARQGTVAGHGQSLDTYGF